MHTKPISIFTLVRSYEFVFDHNVFQYGKADSLTNDTVSNNDRLVNTSNLMFPLEDFSFIREHDGSRHPLYFVGSPNPKEMTLQEVVSHCRETSHFTPHRNFTPKILPPSLISSHISISHHCVVQEDSLAKNNLKNQDGAVIENYTLVKPKRRCILLVDSHLASCLNNELSRSKIFRERLMRNIYKVGGFRRDCLDCRCLTSDTTDYQLLDVEFMLETVTVWPQQILDHAWCVRIVGLLNKHVVLEEGLAWLSTLGGAHSSLGETFLHHAERAGEISVHQMRLAKELGNEVMITRCYLYWSWSLLQRGFLAKSRACILFAWKFCHSLKCGDKVLENMCKAVWIRLKYERSQLCLQKASGKVARPKRFLNHHSLTCSGNDGRVDNTTKS